MKVTGCSQNNLSRPSFGMYIDFHADDMRINGVKTPNYDAINDARIMANRDESVKSLKPQTVYLKRGEETRQSGFPWIFGWGQKITDTWHVVAGNVRSRGVKIPRNSNNYMKIARQLVTLAGEVAKDRRLDDAIAGIAKKGSFAVM